MGVDLITLHALGGERMIMPSMRSGKRREGGPGPALRGDRTHQHGPGELPGYGENLSGLAADLAAGDRREGLDVVCSGHGVEAIKSAAPA